MHLLNRGIALLLIAVLTLIGCGGGGSSSGGTGTAPTVPTGVIATVNSATQISLSWAAVSGATSYNVYGLAAGTPAPPANKLNTSAITTTGYSHAGLTASTAYSYIVTAVNATGESVNSSVVTATTSAAVAPPVAPTGVTATAISASQINLAWVAVPTATGYNVYRSATSPVALIVGNKITATPVVTLSYNDTTGLLASTPYYYIVTAVNPTEGAGSVEAAATTSAPAVTVPAAPTGATATAISATQINLAWATVPTATGYNVYRSTAASVTITVGNKITATPVATLTYNDSTGLTASTPYFYKVTAVNSAGESVSGSNEVTATTNALAVGNVCVVDTTAPLGTGGNYNYKQCYVNRPTGYSCDQVGMGGVASKYHAQYGYPSGSIATYGFSMQAVCPAPGTIFDMGGVFVSTFAGGGGCLSGAACGYSGTGLDTVGYLDDPVGTSALFNYPEGIASDGTNLYVTDSSNNRIRQIVISSGAVTTLAGSGVTPPSNGVNGVGTLASFLSPKGITTDGTSLFVLDYFTGDLRQINIATKLVTTLATIRGAEILTSDGTNLFVVGTIIKKVAIATGVVTDFAGAVNPSTGLPILGTADGIGALARFSLVSGIATDGTTLYVLDNGRIRKIDIATQAVTTWVNTGAPAGRMTIDSINLYVAGDSLIKKIALSTGVISNLAGGNNSFTDGFGRGTGNTVAGQLGQFYSARDIVSVGGNLYVTDSSRSSRIRKIAP